MRVAVAGGGWYGCHIASSLKAHGVSVDLFEKNDCLFSEASGNNQFRLHQGLHYARSAQTRYQSRDGYHRFAERYPKLSTPVENNIYLVPKEASLIDFDTYFSIMLSSGISIEKIPLKSIDHIDAGRFEGAVRCQERVVLTSAARGYFTKRLNGTVNLNHAVTEVQQRDGHVWVDGVAYDHFIDATWGALPSASGESGSVYFEPTLLLYYRLREDLSAPFPAITLVDGDLWSIYPTEDPGVLTQSSVTHTPLGRYENKSRAYERLAAVDANLIDEKRRSMEAEVHPYMPGFKETFTFVGPQFAIKTKPKGLSENRACGVAANGRCFNVQSGKIDNIFYATDRILGALL